MSVDWDSDSEDALNVDNAPYYGCLPLPTSSFELFFKDKHGQAQSVNLASATDEELSILADACSVLPRPTEASESGAGNTYQKSGQLELPNFSIPFQPEGTSLRSGIQESVLGGADFNHSLRLELNKLNVFGEGGFFKAHQDTPRKDNMIGSLVLVYPTAHTGGALVFRHQGQEWTFDSAASVQEGAPAFGYAAFHGDVEHEVLPVTSGYRVTVTYNIYLDDTDTLLSPVDDAVSVNSDFAEQPQHLLDDPYSMSQGDYVGFGLRHAYPVQSGKRDVQQFIELLQGSNAAVLHAARDAGLCTRLHVAYDWNLSKMYSSVTVLTTEVTGELMQVAEPEDEEDDEYDPFSWT